MMDHPTVSVEDVPRDVIARRVVNDLNELRNVEAWRSSHNRELVRLDVNRSNLPPEVMDVLAKHDCSFGGVCLETDLSFQTATVHPPRDD